MTNLIWTTKWDKQKMGQTKLGPKNGTNKTGTNKWDKQKWDHKTVVPAVAGDTCAKELFRIVP